MKRSLHPPDYLIDAIARHVAVLVKMQPGNTREYNAQRLLKKEIKRLLTYKKEQVDELTSKQGYRLKSLVN